MPFCIFLEIFGGLLENKIFFLKEKATERENW